MWTVDIEIEKVCRLYPELKDRLPIVCKCGRPLEPVRVEVSADFVCLESVPCTCGIYSTSGIGVTRSSRANQKWISKYKKLLSYV